MSAYDILTRISTINKWALPTRIRLLCRFIDIRGGEAGLEDFLRKKAEEDALGIVAEEIGHTPPTESEEQGHLVITTDARGEVLICECDNYNAAVQHAVRMCLGGLYERIRVARVVGHSITEMHMVQAP